MDSSFFEEWEKQSKLKTSRNEKREHAKAWAYIGRFLWGFAIVEQAVDRIFADLFDMSAIAYLLCMGNLDFRRKLEFVKVGLKHQGIKPNKAFAQIHKHHNVRNVIAHRVFATEYDGIEFNYVDPRGKLEHPELETSKGFFGVSISFAKFDSYDAQLAHLEEQLENMLDSFVSIAEINKDLALDLENVIEGSDNVIPFPTDTKPEK
jgi:hypothetical protein